MFCLLIIFIQLLNPSKYIKIKITNIHTFKIGYNDNFSGFINK